MAVHGSFWCLEPRILNRSARFRLQVWSLGIEGLVSGRSRKESQSEHAKGLRGKLLKASGSQQLRIEGMKKFSR